MPDFKIAVDAMGSDHAPAVEIEGAIEAAALFGIPIVLVGQEERIRSCLEKHDTSGLSLEIVHASEVITMDESAATAARKKKDSSIRVAARLMREARVSGVVSAGNTGAVMATVKMVLGTLPVVDRPALSTVLPTQKAKPAILLDVGANVDCKPHHLEQFAVMGDIYSRAIFGIRRPRVGLLSIGEEDSKGNELTKEAFKSLKHAPINFIGNVEGRDIFKGEIDVIVCDGFTGNVALKLSEGLIETFATMLRQELEKTIAAKVGYILSERAFRAFRRRLDYSEYGGAPLLGMKGITIVCHGRSNANAIKNAIRVAHDFCKHDVNRIIETEFTKFGITKTAGATQ
ncbi:MAG: phosphate acyltransferase PlsX [Acidobacteria bacterium]|nr:MAG: phosphate acyltransferase PlsX [Acidobacteriota bacterium]